MIEEKTYIDKLAWILIQDKKVLSTISKGKDAWYIPGGKREEGESDIEALTREIREELLVELIPETIKLYGIFEAQAHGKPEGTVVRMTCYTSDFEGVLKASAEIEKYDFLNYLGKERSSPVDKLIFDDLYKKDLIA